MVTSVAVCFVHFALIGLILKYVVLSRRFGFQSFMRLIYTFLSRIYMPLYLHRMLKLRMRCVLRLGVFVELFRAEDSCFFPERVRMLLSL